MRPAAFAALLLAGCVVPQDAPGGPSYLGVRTSLLDGDLVNFNVALKGAATPDAVE
jgi:hypothetical protein